MAKTTISLKNSDQMSPPWFRRVKKAVLILVLAANSMIAVFGIDDTLLVTRLQAWCSIGVGAILEAIEVLLGYSVDSPAIVGEPPEVDSGGSE